MPTIQAVLAETFSTFVACGAQRTYEVRNVKQHIFMPHKQRVGHGALLQLVLPVRVRPIGADQLSFSSKDNMAPKSEVRWPQTRIYGNTGSGSLLQRDLLLLARDSCRVPQ